MLCAVPASQYSSSSNTSNIKVNEKFSAVSDRNHLVHEVETDSRSKEITCTVC